MSALVIDYPRFDVVAYIKKLRNAGATQELAEVQAQEMEYAFDNIIKHTKQEVREVFDNKELVTKGDLEIVKLELQKEIAQSGTKTIIWVSGLLGSFGIFFLGILAKGFHWL